MHLAHTPAGLRLVQVEQGWAAREAEAGEIRLRAFDAAAWGEPRLAPSAPVSASSALADVTLLPVRYLCRADVPAWEGTEQVG
jgi:hypothetical protein